MALDVVCSVCGLKTAIRNGVVIHTDTGLATGYVFMPHYARR